MSDKARAALARLVDPKAWWDSEYGCCNFCRSSRRPDGSEVDPSVIDGILSHRGRARDAARAEAGRLLHADDCAVAEGIEALQ